MRSSVSRRTFVTAVPAMSAALMAGEARSSEGDAFVIHMFAFKWKPSVTTEQKARVMAEIQALRGPIPGLLEVWVGENFSPRSLGYQLGGVMKFADRKALDAYPSHPAHQKLLQWLLPLIEPVEVDFQPLR